MRLARLIASTVWACSLLAAGQSGVTAGPISAVAKETARTIGVLPEIDQLERDARSSSDPLQALMLRQQISEKVLAASLDVDATLAQIDNEIAQANELHGYLSDRRDHSVNRANLWSFIAGGGLGATSAGLQLSQGLTKSSAIVGIAAGTLSTALAITGLRAQKGGSQVLDFDSNMLAKIFDRPVLNDSNYDPVAWTFLGEVAPTDPDHLSRRDRLVQTWITLKRIDRPGTTSGNDKIDRVTSEPSEKIRLTIDDLEDRSAMLSDVRAKLSFLKRDLATLIKSLPPLQVAH